MIRLYQARREDHHDFHIRSIRTFRDANLAHRHRLYQHSLRQRMRFNRQHMTRNSSRLRRSQTTTPSPCRRTPPYPRLQTRQATWARSAKYNGYEV
jgi:hypothetical protein